VKFTTKGTITVKVLLLSENDKNVTIQFSIADTGIGIAENKMTTIFGNFQQATSGTSRLYGGTGLGLSIVKQLVEPQGGKVKAESTFGKGSTFTFILNFDKTNIKIDDTLEILDVDDDLKNIKILVVEDIALNQLLMKTLLDDFGFDRDIAGNGKIAIEKLQTKTYDIVLMDLQMPEMNGFEATDFIRNKLHSKIPIIALTADVTTADLAKCKSVGMNDYIAKPVDERLLYNKIISLVKKKPYHKNENTSINLSTNVRINKCTDLQYLTQLTKSNSKLMMEMISLYLEQTPPLINTMKKSLEDKDWISLQSAIHKMIPSFSIMGIAPDFEEMAKKVQEYAISQEQTDTIPYLVSQIEEVCNQACIELKAEFNSIKST
jgi:CheY-like chemotaxis protein